jgi:hypothetical protein
VRAGGASGGCWGSAASSSRRFPDSTKNDCTLFSWMLNFSLKKKKSVAFFKFEIAQPV